LTFAGDAYPRRGERNVFHAANQMTTFGGGSLSYDSNGNLTGDGTNSYTWDARNHLATIAGPTSGSFVYDALGRRAKKTIAGATTQFLYDGLNPLQELDGGNPATPTVNLLTGLGIDEYFSRTDASGTSTMLADMLGSVIALTNPTGGITTQYSYEPFGKTSGATANPYQFTGRENDGTGFYYYRARYYHPTLQRFMSQDPIEFGGGQSNLYAYVSQSPLSFLDPLGLLTIDQVGRILFNETRSLSGPDIGDARYNIAQAIFNGARKFGDSGRPRTASDTVDNVPDGEIATYNSCMGAAEKAHFDRKQGIDPTDGATHFNQRPNDSRDPFLRNPISTQSGPFNNSFPSDALPGTGIYSNTYR
jgi:RHS repeat-associated protein